MDENPQSPPSSGWTFGKIVGVVIGLIGMVGFGVCTLCGTVLAFDYGDAGIWLMILGGAVMTWLCTWLVTTMFRKAREERDRNNS